jgi:ATP-dependent helicase/nuclease subunit B
VRRNVFSIPPGVPFLATFVDAFLNGDVVDSVSRASGPLDLASATIFVPTQRAGRALAVEFGKALKTPSALLPRILPLGGLDEQETQALFDSAFDISDFDVMAPAIDEINRRLVLSSMIIQWASALRYAIVSIDPTGAPEFDLTESLLVASSPASAYALAGELGALIDEFAIENVNWTGIDRLTDESFDRFWAITTRFLRIALHEWPEILRERGLIDKAARKIALIDAQTARLTTSDDDAAVIALGSTGANAATARLLAAIARKKRGAVILPGLDCNLDETAWRCVGDPGQEGAESAFTHPQALLKRLLGDLGVKRDDVRRLGEQPEDLRAREALVAQALRPADATEGWRDYQGAHVERFNVALNGVAFVEALDEREEALTLALFMREALETPERTAALVTPDRDIARRVAGELARWEIDIDDSGGKPLAATHIGALAHLLAETAEEELTAANVASLLSHPLASFGVLPERVAELAPLVEIAVLRSVERSKHGWAGAVSVARELAARPHAYPILRRILPEDWTAIEDLLARVDQAIDLMASLPFEAELNRRMAAHRQCLASVVAGLEGPGSDAGLEELFAIFDKIETSQSDAALKFDARSYSAFFDRLTQETVVRGPRRAHPRLKILGPLEARLLSADLVLLAGLDETVWPPQAEAGTFLNRSMRRQLGLSPPERRIGQSAHDFAMALGAQRIVISRARKRRGAPTIESRFVGRLKALSGGAFAACRNRGDSMLAVAAALDRPSDIRSVERPRPSPPLESRPRQLSVTKIETLRRDPYAIYAEHILKLIPLAPLGYEKGAREIGTAIHAALANFICEFPSGPLPHDACERLLAFAKSELDGFLHDASFLSFEWPRIEAGLDHALNFERERREKRTEIFVETRGEWRFPLNDGSTFVLSGVADRIEVDGNVAAVFDYKTGKPPSNKQVEAGLAPQLTLEAAMIEAGAFEKIGKRAVDCAAYVRIGGADGGETQWVEVKDKSFPQLADEHRRRLVELLNQFREADAAYPSRPFVEFASRYGDYDHLARVKEWSRDGGGERE